MKRLLIATAIGIAAGVVAVQSQPVADILHNVYPSDPNKQQALDLCMLADPNFNRLDSSTRDACYRHAGSAPMLAVAPATTVNAPNPVDLKQDAGRGTAPRNDVRVVQATQGSPR